jgi:hypothetical protein
MSDRMRPDDAEARLARIRATQARLIDRVSVPLWYWWAVAVATVALGLTVDEGRAVFVALGACLFAVSVAGATAWVILGGGRVQVSRALLGDAGALRIIGFVGAVVGVSLTLGFGLRAAGAPFPATVATLVAGIALAGGGPLLMRGLRRTMLRQRAAR